MQVASKEHGERIGKLTALFHHRWTVPVLAEFHRRKGATKFVTLVNRLGGGRDSVRRALDALVELGLVARNTGYGHPMRPEYLLTRAGALAAPACARVWRALRAMESEDVGLNKWSLLVALALKDGCSRFAEFRRYLPEVTPRALTLALKSLGAAGWIEREILDAYPPRTQYRLTLFGGRLWPGLRALAG